MVYVCTFLITLFFSYINEKNLMKKNVNKFVQYITAFLIVFIPSLIAGLRDLSVGTDTMLYAKPVFEYACDSNKIIEMFVRFPQIEYGFLIIAYIVSRISSNIHLFLFIISVIIQLFIYLALYRVRDKYSIFVGEAIALLLLFNPSLNMMRQTIAMVIMLFALTYFWDKKYVKFFIYFIIALVFHKSTIIGCVYILIFWFINEKDKNINLTATVNKKSIKYVVKTLILIMAFIIAAISFKFVVLFLYNIGIIGDRFLAYIDGEAAEFNYKFFIIYSLSYIYLFNMRKRNLYGYTYLTIGIIDTILYCLKYMSYYLYRISVYFMTIRIFSMSQVKIDFKKIIRTGKISKEQAITLLMLLLIFLQWYAFIIINNDHNTKNYLFYFGS